MNAKGMPIEAKISEIIPFSRPQLQELRTRCLAIQDVIDLGFKVISWNGLDATCLTGKDRKIIAILAGQPWDSSY